MRCRCNDMKKCDNDINVLKGIINTLEDLSDYDNSIQYMLTNLNYSSRECVSPSNIEILVEQEAKLNDSVISARNQLIDMCTDKVENLIGLYNSMEDEDSEYHLKMSAINETYR